MPPRNNLAGRTFGRLTVIEWTTNHPKYGYRWRCACACGAETDVLGSNLTSGAVTSCGCNTRKPLTPGQRFGLLTVVEQAGHNAGGEITWRCRCDCGTEKDVSGNKLRNGRTNSCGCASRTSSLSHGASRSALYRRWTSMMTRTTNPNHHSYPDYGGRGITVCESWRSYENFARDMSAGFEPGLTLERIDNDRGYEPGNVRWATPKEQARNRRDSRFETFNGHTHTVAEWAELLGLNPDTLYHRLNHGWPVDRALTTGADAEALARLSRPSTA